MQPWVEKYRPRTLNDVVFQDEVVKVLKKSLESSSLPHLLFYGPPGTGKTSTIRAISSMLFGPEFRRKRVLELNASDERGIDVVRNKVKKFAQTSVGEKPSGYKYPCPKFKIIVLDEADSMTKEAQAALRRTMERYSKVTRFCLICNYVTRIIEPVTSRCAKFRFKSLDKPGIIGHLKRIAKKEKITCEDEVFDELFGNSEGDMRKAITMFQSAVRMYGRELKSCHIVEIAGVVPEEVLDGIWEAAKNENLQKMEEELSSCIQSGYNSIQLLHQINDGLVGMDENEDFGSIEKSKICWKLAKAERCLADGADEYIQLFTVFSCILKQYKMFKESKRDMEMKDEDKDE